MMNRPLLAGLLGCALLALSAGAVAAFCGFYVANAARSGAPSHRLDGMVRAY